MVDSRGIGKPDFVAITAPTRTEVEATSQTGWVLPVFSLVLPPASVYTAASAYTVPAGKKLIIGLMKGSVNIDSLFKSAVLKNGSVFTCSVCAVIITIPVPDTAGYVFNAGDVFGFTIDNPLDVPVIFTGSFSGFLYDIGTG